ncbi:DUF3857 domain-containing protein [Pseudoflavitalea sp. G-6-1-2]|uniref:DUF3857 domain-containing protein n=1 Tax=Pseudoflavitalea sp. G-6-1-2 TaxID=2728841 RepID=UPI00146AC021|nr:DUF3857 domain-containing protein [Pseudoflavitalea sp. G-6-1-2]NML23765.1 DUF3857 domain-containing protein [Pseudoflavitalea sp. G-6-1-2]
MRFVYCCALILLMSNAMSQTKVPEYGTFLSTEKELQICEFDPEAEAVIIFDQAYTTHNEDRNLITKRRIRIKVLKAKGIERGNVEIPYYSKDEFEEISGIKAIVRNVSPSGAEDTKELASSAIFKSKINERVSIAKFAVPDVRVGSIFEYEYTIVAKNYNGLNDWKFQSSLPIMLSTFDLEIMPNLEFAYQVYKSPSLPHRHKEQQEFGKDLFRDEEHRCTARRALHGCSKRLHSAGRISAGRLSGNIRWQNKIHDHLGRSGKRTAGLS